VSLLAPARDASKKFATNKKFLDKYALYEMIDYPKGEKVYRDSYSTLRRTRQFLEACPHAAGWVRRLWFNGLYLPETDADIFAIIRACPNLTSVSAPWTLLRHGSPEDWAALLSADKEFPLQSLELTATRLSEAQQVYFSKAPVVNSLGSPLVDFSKLRRLKLFGNTETLPACDEDLKAIARTANHIEEFQMTCISTVTMDGVMAVVRSSRDTIRVIEHSPRSDDGFWHPHPGNLSTGEHICDLLTSCPKLEDLSISIPTMCSKLFSNNNVRWRGDCQVRALGLCGDHTTGRSNMAHHELRDILSEARKLTRTRACSRFPAELTLEIFFADMIFDPHVSRVHGDFQDAEYFSDGTWPLVKNVSRKGPYGSTGLYGKEEESVWECLSEDELFSGLARNIVRL
jgi:hypothetical protein